jgi:DNA-directed RNA polymerase subunit RPC12/RpoP
MSAIEHRDRRARPSVALVVQRCRLCWRAFEVERRDVELTDQHVYVRCRHCGGSFPIRHSDLDALNQEHLGPDALGPDALDPEALDPAAPAAS